MLGNYTGAITVLTLTGLPVHTAISLSFDLAIIASWDGNTGGLAAPDYFNVRVDDQLVFSETFDQSNLNDQTAPTSNLITWGTDLGYGGWLDSAYHMGDPVTGLNNIPHSGNTLKVEFYASGRGWQGGNGDEWFGIDNVTVSTIPEPKAAGLVTAVTLIAMASRWRQRRGRLR